MLSINDKKCRVHLLGGALVRNGNGGEGLDLRKPALVLEGTGPKISRLKSLALISFVPTKAFYKTEFPRVRRPKARSATPGENGCIFSFFGGWQTWLCGVFWYL